MAASTLNPVSLMNLLVCLSAENISCRRSEVMNGSKEEPQPTTACCRALSMYICTCVCVCVCGCVWVPQHVWMCVCVLWVCVCVVGVWVCGGTVYVCVCICAHICCVLVHCECMCVSVCMQVCVRVHVYVQSLCACVCWIEFLDKKGAAQKACACVYVDVYMLSLRAGKWDALPTISHGWYD